MATFLLLNNNKIIDSVKISNIDYRSYYFDEINDSIYHLSYLFYSDSETLNMFNCTYRRQIVFHISDRRIRIALINEEENSCFPDSPLKPNSDERYFSYTFYPIWEKLNESKLLLKCTNIDINTRNGIQIDTNETTIEYLFDKTASIFYQQYDTLIGRFQYEIKRNGGLIGFKDIFFDHEIVPVNKSEDFFYSFFYKDRWYTTSRSAKSPVIEPFRELKLDTSILDDIKNTAE